MGFKATKSNTKVGDILVLVDASSFCMFDGLKTSPAGQKFVVLEKFDHTFKAKRIEETDQNKTGIYCYFRFEHEKKEK